MGKGDRAEKVVRDIRRRPYLPSGFSLSDVSMKRMTAATTLSERGE
jgi:hypothetical protein